MSHNALVSALKEKKISLSTYVWNEDMSDWKTLTEISGFSGPENTNPRPNLG